MKRLLIPLFLLFSSTTFAALDTGTGLDGSCDETTFGTVGGTWNCTDLTISAVGLNITTAGLTPLIIKVQGDVIINGTITIDPGTAGGYPYNDSSTPSGAQGGDGGDAFCDTLTPDTIGGGGGSGGSHSSLGTAGIIGTDSGTVDGDIPGAPGSTPSITYDSAMTLETQLRGGASGGQGGTGCIDGGTESNGVTNLPGDGGGAIQITAGGDITIYANISAIGGSGDGGASSVNGDAGGSGGGAGGVIFLQAANNIVINNASLDAQGGSGGAGGGSEGGAGGAGADGIIRLDDIDGSIEQIGTVNISPTPTTVALEAASFETLNSGIQPGCAVNKDMATEQSQIIGLLILMAAMIGLYFKKLKKITRTW